MPEKTVTYRLRGVVTDYQNAMRQAQRSTRELGSGVADFSRRHEQAMTTAGMAAMAFGATTALGLKKAGDAAIQLNAEMANVATLIPGSTERVYELRDGVQDLAIEVGKGTSDLSAGLYQTISAFGDTGDSMQVLRANARAAAGGLAETTEAINLTSAVTKGYGDTSAQAVEHAADLALTTVRLGQTTFPELAASIGRVVPLAASLGVAQEELFAVMATGTGVTGTAAEVSTQLRGVLQSLMAPTADMTTLLDEHGFASGEAALADLGLQGAIEMVVQAAEASGTPLQKYMSQIEGQTLAMALAGPQADVLTEKIAAMGDASGATDAAVREQTEGINAAGFTAEQASVQWEVASQKLGESVAPVWGRLASMVGDAAEAFSDMSPEAQRAFATAGMAASGIGLVGGAALIALPRIIAINDALKRWGGIAGATRSSVRGLARFVVGPYGIALAAGTKATYELVGGFREGRQAAREMAEEIIATSDSAEEAGERIRDSLSEHLSEVRSVESAWERFKQGFSFDVVGDVVRDGAQAWALWRSDAEEATEATLRGKNAIELLNSGVGGWVDRLGTASVVTDEMRAAAAEAGVEINETTGEVKAAESAFDALAPSIEAAFTTLAASFDPMRRYADNLAAMNEANRKAAEETATATESSKDSWEDYFTETEASFAAYMSGLEQTLADQREWHANLNTIREVAGDEYADMLAAQGPEFASLHAEIANAEHDEIRKAAETAQTIRDEAIQEGVDRLIASTPEWVDAAGQVSEATRDEIAEKLGTTRDVVDAAIANSIPALEAQFRAMEASASTGARAVVAAMAWALGKGTAEAARIVNAWTNVTGECLSPLIMRPYTENPP